MTLFSDLPASIQQGTLTACASCGRIALFAEYRLPPNATMDDDGQNHLDCDRWGCGGCGRVNEIPVRDNRKGEKG